MLRLLDRNRQIPYGLSFKLVEANWTSQPWSSFDTLVTSAMQVAKANPYLAQKSKWPTTREGWEQTIDAYNAAICKAHGWTGYYSEKVEGGQPPKSTPRHSLGGLAVAGGSVLLEMFGKEGPIQDREKATARAAVCLKCPKHDTGDWKRFFTTPAQYLIMRTLGALKDLNLMTSHDDQLKVCLVCDCPMRGKVWARVEHILKHLPAEDKSALDTNCWITAEEKSLEPRK